jgi:hypothetical protein
MNIKKSRIIQIIKEEIQKITEDDGDDSGLAPVSLTRTTPAPALSDDLAQIEMQIHFLEEKLAELQARRAELAGEESEHSEVRPTERPEETQVGDTDYLKKVMGIK